MYIVTSPYSIRTEAVREFKRLRKCGTELQVENALGLQIKSNHIISNEIKSEQ